MYINKLFVSLKQMEDLRLKHAYLKAQDVYITATKQKMLTKFQNMLTDKGKTKLLHDSKVYNQDDKCKSCSNSCSSPLDNVGDNVGDNNNTKCSCNSSGTKVHTNEELRLIYKKLMLQYHPDKNHNANGDDNSDDTAKYINLLYEQDDYDTLKLIFDCSCISDNIGCEHNNVNTNDKCMNIDDINILKDITRLETDINKTTQSVFWMWCNGNSDTKIVIENMFVSDVEYTNYWTTANGVLEQQNIAMKDKLKLVVENNINNLKTDINTIITKCQDRMVDIDRLIVSRCITDVDEYVINRQRYVDKIQQIVDIVSSANVDTNNSSQYYNDMWHRIFDSEDELRGHYWRISNLT